MTWQDHVQMWMKSGEEKAKMKMEEQVFFFDLTQDQFKTWGKTEIFDEI